IEVDVGAEEPISIATNARCGVGERVVVALVGATLKDGTQVKKTQVGGVLSEGMLCDSPMLGWTGGAVGIAALVSEDFPPGSTPPSSRPR
ncbi:unnamed protein product, partial [Chrysoparadoxa australica]